MSENNSGLFQPKQWQKIKNSESSDETGRVKIKAAYGKKDGEKTSYMVDEVFEDIYADMKRTPGYEASLTGIKEYPVYVMFNGNLVLHNSNAEKRIKEGIKALDFINSRLVFKWMRKKRDKEDEELKSLLNNELKYQLPDELIDQLVTIYIAEFISPRRHKINSIIAGMGMDELRELAIDIEQVLYDGGGMSEKLTRVIEDSGVSVVDCLGAVEDELLIKLIAKGV